jgi:transposase-like protein
MMAERGVEVDHSSLNRWVLKGARENKLIKFSFATGEVRSSSHREIGRA